MRQTDCHHDQQFSSTRHISHYVRVICLIGVASCGGGNAKPPVIPPNSSVDTLYTNGIDALKTQRYVTAAAEFEALQQNHPYSNYIANAQLLEAYAYYLKEKYPQAVLQLNRFIALHPTSHDAPYAFYLRALCFFEQIADVQRDQQATAEAMDALEEVLTRFPESSYARDAQMKIDLCRDHLAGKEMSVGRYYEQQHSYASAINRYQRVVQDFQTTDHVPESLERMVEIYLDLGLIGQAHKAAVVLGYNYPDSSWYHRTYQKLKKHHLLVLPASYRDPNHINGMSQDDADALSFLPIEQFYLRSHPQQAAQMQENQQKAHPLPPPQTTPQTDSPLPIEPGTDKTPKGTAPQPHALEVAP